MELRSANPSEEEIAAVAAPSKPSVDTRRFLSLAAIVFAVLCVVLGIIGGTMYGIVNTPAIKDMRVTSTNDLVSVQTGKLVHVLSTEARSPVSGWDASWTDEKLNALKTLTLTLASGSKTTGEVVAVIRVDNTTVVVVIKSPVVPAVLIKDKEVYILTDADVEAVVQAVLAGEKLSTELMDLLMKTRIGSDMVMGSGMMTPRPM